MGAFVSRMHGDFIVGYLFEGRALDRIVQHEAELAISHLGGEASYTGRPIGAVHRPLRINRGHFRRRLAILRTLLSERGVPEDIIERWIAHDAALEAVVTDGIDCVPGGPDQ
ncbi:MAG TPA: hypothetical protein ENK18_28500, partial [Deltaproteobacteria bacterium]|nr:hypothetical protein [Deltaproteobacteria bacterium]